MKTPWTAILIGGLLATGCADGTKDEILATGDTGAETTSELGTIADVLADEGQFSNLLGGAVIAGLTPLLSDENAGPYTVFAPTDAAFEQAFEDLGIADPTALISNTALLNALLRYHIVEGEIPSSAITGPGLTTDTLAELTLFYAPSGDTVGLNGGAEAGTTGGADVSAADLEASNGVVHIIDRVMLPPDVVSAAIYATRSGNAAFGELAAALDTAGLTEGLQVDLIEDDLNTVDTFTVLAPVDDGFPDMAPANLAQVLQYHVVPGTFDAASLPGMASTLAVQGAGGPTDVALTVFFDTTAAPVVNGGSGGVGADVVTADIRTLNGVVHVVDEALSPLDIAQVAEAAGLTELLGAVTASDPGQGAPIGEILANETIGLLAPSNAAFTTAFPGGLPDGPDVYDLLVTHVITDVTLPTSGNLATTAVYLNGNVDEITFDIAATPPTASLASGNAANIDVVDLGAVNGVVHVIDTVLQYNPE